MKLLHAQMPTRIKPSLAPFAPLPIPPVIPYAWEDLASVLSRVAAEMGYKNVAWLLHPEEIDYKVQPYQLCLLQRENDYRFLGRLLRLDEETLYHLTLHRLSAALPSPEHVSKGLPGEVQRPLLTRYLFQSFCHPYSATKVCPLCLAEEPVYARIFWSALPVIGCLRHQIFLVDRCPHCQKMIPILRTSLTRCPHCKDGNYLEAPLIPLPADPLLLQAQGWILERLGVRELTEASEIAVQIASPLLELLPWQYFQLLDAFRNILGPLFPDAPFLRGAREYIQQLDQHRRPHSGFSLIEWAVFITTFHALFLDWPEQFLAFLEIFPLARAKIARKRDRVHTTGVQRDFGVFYEKWLSKRLTHPAFTFLHETFRQYLKSQYKGGEVTNRLTPFRQTNQETTPAASYLTKGQARKALEIGEPVLQKLINQGKIRVHQKLMGPSAKRTLSLIEKQSVEALKLEWETLITLESVCKVHLGITKAVVLTLEEAELLLPTRGPKTDGYKQRYYHPQAMKDLEQLLLAHSVKRGDSWSEAIPLAAVSQQVGIRLVTLVKAVLDNQIMLLDRSVEEPLFQRFLLPRAEIAGYLERQRHHQREALALMNAREAALELGVSERVLCRWARKGLLERTTAGVDGKGPSLWFRRETLMTFRQTYLFTEEVAKELQVETHTVSKYVRKGFLHPITGRRTDEGGIRLLFRREEIENFRALNCAHPIRGR